MGSSEFVRLANDIRSLAGEAKSGHPDSILHRAQNLLNADVPRVRAPVPFGREFDQVENKLAAAVRAFYSKACPDVAVRHLYDAAETIDRIVS